MRGHPAGSSFALAVAIPVTVSALRIGLGDLCMGILASPRSSEMPLPPTWPDWLLLELTASMPATSTGMPFESSNRPIHGLHLTIGRLLSVLISMLAYYLIYVHSENRIQIYIYIYIHIHTHAYIYISEYTIYFVSVVVYIALVGIETAYVYMCVHAQQHILT